MHLFDVSAFLPIEKSRYLLKESYFFCSIAFLLGFSLPISPALLQIALVFLVFALFMQRDTSTLKALIRSPLIWLPALGYLLLVVSLVMHFHSYGPDMVGKYRKLLYVLPLALFFSYDRQLIWRCIQGFLLANLVILLISFTSGVSGLTLGSVQPANPTVFKLQITQNFFMALAALGWLFLAWNRQGKIRWGYALLALMACCNVLLQVEGRTGYIALLAAIGIWLFCGFTLRQRIVLVICSGVLITLFMMIPNRASERVWLGVEQIQGCLMSSKEDAYASCDNSMGQRTAFTLKSFVLIKQAPILGNGPGAFHYDSPDPTSSYSVKNPHNEYLLTTINTGLVGLAVFLVWVFYCYRAAWQQPMWIRNLLFGVLSAYMVSNLFNSFLLDFAEGHLYVTLVAIIAALTLRPLPSKPQSISERV